MRSRVLRAGLGHIPPQLPTLVDAPPDGDEWIHEIKHDGYRTLLVVEDGSARAFTRRGHDWTSAYAPVTAAAAQLACRSAIIDGEAVVQDERGVSDFHELRRAIEEDNGRIVFFAFDLLHLDGADLRGRPLEERRARLGELIGARDPLGRIQFSDDFGGDGAALFAAAESAGLEGIVSKRKGSRYRSGQSSAWLKTKCEVEGEFIVVGAEPNPGGAPYALLAREDDTGLTYAGAAFVTLSQPEREAFWTRSETLKIRRPVAAAGLDTRKRKVSWFRPEMRVRAKHLRGGNMLRHARLTMLH